MHYSKRLQKLNFIAKKKKKRAVTHSFVFSPFISTQLLATEQPSIFPALSLLIQQTRNIPDYT